MSELRNNREPRKRLKFGGTYYDIVAGALYVFLAYFLYSKPPESLSPGVVQVVMVVFAIYGFFRVGRGIYRIMRK